MPDFPVAAVRAAAEAMQEEEDTRTWPTWERLARIALEAAEPLRVAALADAGMVVVSAEDLDLWANRSGHPSTTWEQMSEAHARLRAALPERGVDGG